MSVTDALSPFKFSIAQDKVWAFSKEPHWTENGALNIAKVVAKELTAGELIINANPQIETRSRDIEPVLRHAFDDRQFRLPSVKYIDYNFFSPSTKYFMTGFSTIENGDKIWSLGQRAKLFFESVRGNGAISLKFDNPVEHQEININFNGKSIYAKKRSFLWNIEINSTLKFISGDNTIEIIQKSGIGENQTLLLLMIAIFRFIFRKYP
ncbi:hypothetical protein [Deinococcus irradiatisoli]|uniref:hypothetical protein n=1 Tax=Deinococcus irradiatisoli TaxID=2202254 RepID=UPI0011B2288D|nr:hypothetical protein [Deinococcus irradiatisoli]